MVFISLLNIFFGLLVQYWLQPLLTSTVLIVRFFLLRRILTVTRISSRIPSVLFITRYPIRPHRVTTTYNLFEILLETIVVDIIECANILAANLLEHFRLVVTFAGILRERRRTRVRFGRTASFDVQRDVSTSIKWPTDFTYSYLALIQIYMLPKLFV